MPPAVAAVGQWVFLSTGSFVTAGAAAIAAQAALVLGTQFAINADTRAFVPRKQQP